jgi:uncharacterized repeat protein (TIGR02059 family)
VVLTPSQIGQQIFTVGIYDANNNLKGNAFTGNFEIVNANSAAPIFQHATAVGKTLTLSFTDSSLQNTSIPTSAFSVITDGVSDSVTAVAVNSQDQTVTLTLATPINYTESITKFTYMPPADSTKAIRDLAGNITASFGAQIIKTPSLQKSEAASTGFAVIKEDGSVVTWGPTWTNINPGSDSSSVAVQLDGSDNSKDVVKIYANGSAMAALRTDGSVITWGAAQYGGDSSSVASQLDGSDNSKDVVQLYSIHGAGGSGSFAALRADGSVITWGGQYTNGGDSSSVAAQLDGSDNSKDVVSIYSTGAAFAALRADGSVITWGNGSAGGDSSSVASQLDGSDNSKDVVQLYSIHGAGYLGSFAALRADGSVITWGGQYTNGGDSSSVATKIDGLDNSKDVVQIYSNAALRADGSAVTWGSRASDSSSVATELNGLGNNKDVVQIFQNNRSAAALRADGSVITWNEPSADDFINSVASQLNGINDSKDVVKIYSTFAGGFAALRADGSVTTWGYYSVGGDSSSVAAQLDGSDNSKDVVQITPGLYSFAALRADGSVINWGGEGAWAVNSNTVANQINGLDNNKDVVKLYTNGGGYAALRADGSVVTWGAYVGNAPKSLSSGVVDFADSHTDTFINGLDNTPPVVNSASVNGNTIILKMSDINHLSSTTAPANAYMVMVNGVVNTVLSANVYPAVDIVMLSLTNSVMSGQSVLVRYADPSSSDDLYALQDIVGNDEPSFTIQSVQ